jgi:hypothetical protein
MSVNPEDMYDQSLMVDERIQPNGYFVQPKKPVIQQRTSQSPQQQYKPQIKRCRMLMKKNSKLNNKIISFFKTNIHVLNSKGFVFEWIPVYEEEIEFYEDQQITKFPTLVINIGNIVGVSNIISKLQEFIAWNPSQNQNQNQSQNQSRNQNSQIKKETDEEVHDYFMNEMNKDDRNDDEDEDGDGDRSKRTAAMLTSRQSMGLPTGSSSTGNPEVHETVNKKTPPSQQRKVVHSTNTADIAKSMSNGSKEDDMMAAFWDNQEETPM